MTMNKRMTPLDVHIYIFTHFTHFTHFMHPCSKARAAK